MSELTKTIATAAIKEAMSVAVEMARADGVSPTAAKARIERTLEQDPALRSWRIWGSVWASVAAVLAIPEVQLGIQALVGAAVPVAWAPVVPAVMGAVWPVVSKIKDIRPIKGAGPSPFLER